MHMMRLPVHLVGSCTCTPTKETSTSSTGKLAVGAGDERTEGGGGKRKHLEGKGTGGKVEQGGWILMVLVQRCTCGVARGGWVQQAPVAVGHIRGKKAKCFFGAPILLCIQYAPK